ncbi:MAG: energy-coupling factor transporter transmembrane component T family protein [Microbacterium gubbeenense]
MTAEVAATRALPASDQHPRTRVLERLHPLAKIGATTPTIVLLVAVRDIGTPLALLVVAYAIVLAGARITRHGLILLAVVLPVFVAATSVGFALWADPSQVGDTHAVVRIGDWTLSAGALLVGLATGLRFGAMLALGLITALTTTGRDIVLAGMQSFRLPYRVGYTALAALGFIPRFAHELSIIRAAHRVRGSRGGRGPLGRIRREMGHLVPLLASAIRHAERVALAMDARAFGAHPTRTERRRLRFSAGDIAFTAGVLLATALVFTAGLPWRLG